MITAILMSYKRKPNMEKIVETYRSQSVPVEIWMINNNGLEDFGADKLIAVPWNAGEMARYIWCARPETDWVCFQDDDFIIQDNRFVEDAIGLVEERPGYLVGVAGMNINWETQNMYAPEAKKDRGAAILKGHFQCFRRDYATKVRIMGHWAASDIWWSMDVSRGAPAHLVSADLCKRMGQMDRHGVGLEFRPEHYPERSGAVREIVKKDRIKRYWWNNGDRDGAYRLYPEDYDAR